MHADTMMAGQSHFSHAQPTTYGAYLLAVYDGLVRGLSQLDLAYRYTNQNSGGCGACSGTGWPVDRELVTDLLGFDSTIELSYDCEGSQDEIPQIMFALSSIALTLSRTGMDHSIWTREEIGTVMPSPAWQGVSSFMPQKAHGYMFENVRVAADEVLGEMMKVVTTYKGEAIQDVIPVYKTPRHVFHASTYARQGLGFLRCLLATQEVDRDRMLEIVRNGYSGAPDLAITMIRAKGYGGRRAHRICCNFVRLARERGIKPYEMTGALLDEAARVTAEPEPHLTDAEVQESMGLEGFFQKHDGLGDPHPDETRRLIAKRRAELEDLRSSQAERRRRLADADARLHAEIDAICGR
jgi:argininosuccinate lyase